MALPRPRVLLAIVALVVASCTEAPRGPAQPLPQDAIDASFASDALGARVAVFDFIHAYASVPAHGPLALETLSATADLKAWAHWLGVQTQQFPGTVTGRLQIADVGPAQPAAIPSTAPEAGRYRDIQVNATAAFRFTPDHGSPFPVQRRLDGPMRVFRTNDGRWLVTDFIRDGVPMSAAFQLVSKDVVDAGTHLAVRLDSVVAFPTWQFDVVLAADERYALVHGGATLVDAGGNRVGPPGATTASLSSIQPGRPVEGIATFPTRPSLDGLSLRLRFRGPQGPAEVRFPLAGTFTPVGAAGASPAASSAPPTPSASPAA